MVFEPIKGANAIVEVVFFFQFNNEFETDLIQKFAALEHRSEFAEFFNNFDLIHGANFELNVQTRQQSISQLKDIGVQMQRILPNGSEEWRLRIESSSISIHCFDYTRWGAVWKQTADFIKKLFHIMESYSGKLLNTGLRYVDQFTYKGNAEEYKTAELFNVDSDYLHKKAFNSGVDWHCFTGWIDKNPKSAGSVLNQLHIGSSLQNGNDNSGIITFIDHLQTLKALPNEYQIESLFQTLHHQNKSLMVEILKHDFCDRMNLKLEGEKI